MNYVAARLRALRGEKPTVKKCRHADTYKAKHPPCCDPLCEVCYEKWLLKNGSHTQ